MGEKRTVTQEDLDLNPELVEQGVKVGDEIELGHLCDENGEPLEGAGLTGEAERGAEDADSQTDIVGGREKDDR